VLDPHKDGGKTISNIRVPPQLAGLTDSACGRHVKQPFKQTPHGGWGALSQFFSPSGLTDNSHPLNIPLPL
jgi:hypothetical protein